MRNFIFDKQLFLLLVIAFIIATIAGTISHELGHFLAAKLYGLSPSLSYQSTHWSNPGNASYSELVIVGAGPLQTMLTGTIGFVALLFFRSKLLTNLFLYWLFIFLSLFWLRQVADFAMWIYSDFVNNNVSTTNDEIRLDLHFGFPVGTLLSISAMLGLIVSLIIIFHFVPRTKRVTFISGAATGCFFGFIVWIYLLGPRLMP